MKLPVVAPRNGGFALVVTVALMILLTVIAVGFLTLSSVSLRASAQGEAMAVARSNARLALMLAIGDLQIGLGPDRRVNANAEIRKSANAEKSKWTGVWKTDNWKPGDPTRNKTFVAWMVSDPMLRSVTSAADREKQADSPLQAMDGKSKRVALVGGGSLGTGTASADGKVEMFTTPVGAPGVMSGSYAYWVGDEGSKARYDLGDARLLTDVEKAARWGAPSRTGIQKIRGMEVYQTLSDEVSSKALSQDTIELVQGQPAPPNLFHHVTTHSVGLPVDVRMGGGKHDLSLAFELSLSEFKALSQFRLDRETNDTSWGSQLNAGVYGKPEFYPSSHQLGYVCLIPADAGASEVVRGPSWDLLRNHYRLYKREWESLSWPRKLVVSPDAVEARGSLPLSYSSQRSGAPSIANRFTAFNGESMLYSKSMKGAYSDGSVSRQSVRGGSGATVPIRRTAGKVMPIVTRVTFVFGLARGVFPRPGTPPGPDDKETVAVSWDPYITICNPYNKPIEFHSIGCYASKFNPFTFSIDYTDGTGTTRNTGDFRISQNYFNQGSFAFRLNPSTVSGGKMRLEPGELRVISPEEVSTGVRVERAGATPLSGTAVYNEDSGIAIVPPSPVLPKAGSTVTLNIRGRDANSGWQEVDMMDFHLFLPKLHSGQSRTVTTDIPPVADVYTDTDSLDDPHLFKMGYSTYPSNGTKWEVRRTISSTQIPIAGQAGQFVAALDMWMKDFKSGDVAVLAQFNPRATSADPRDYDGSNRISPGWEAKLLPITDISTLNLVTASNQGRWGGGVGGGGPSHVCLYDIPSAPLTSLAQLQHAEVGAFPTDAPYAIGNSYPPPAIPLGRVYHRLSLASQDHTGWGPQPQVDLSWAANEMLWDRFFFSGVNWGSANRHASVTDAIDAMSDSGKPSPFANSRVFLASRPASSTVLGKSDTIGNYLGIRGAFNINSTSDLAWKAVLAGLDQVELDYLSGGAMKSGKFNSPVSRFSRPAGNESDVYRGFRSLDDAKLDALAKAIVEQVKLRGPFMGLADFVNRRMDSSALAKAGAIQAAIDASGINAALSGAPSAGNVMNRIQSTQAGLPGSVSQADVLSAIGSFIGARSDTFKIRAYGDATDSKGKVVARVWCEAVLQRTPQWTNATDVPATISNSRYTSSGPRAGEVLPQPFSVNPAFPKANQTFGRRFEIVQFRWLSETEV